MSKITEIIDFFENECDDVDALMNHVQSDLKFKVDSTELTQLYDTVNGKNIKVSLEDITKAILKRVIIAIETFTEDADEKM